MTMAANTNTPRVMIKIIIAVVGEDLPRLVETGTVQSVSADEWYSEC